MSTSPQPSLHLATRWMALLTLTFATFLVCAWHAGVALSVRQYEWVCTPQNHHKV